MIFSPLQQEIINQNSGALLIQGVPGSGKTSVVAERVGRYIESRKFSNLNILAPSHLPLNKLRMMLEKSIKKDLLYDKVKFNTFNEFSLEILLRFGSYVGISSDTLTLDDENDKMAILSDVICNDPIYATISQDDNKLSSFISKCITFISYHKRHFITPELSSEDALFQRIYHKYNESLKFRKTLDDDDILFYTTKLLIENYTLPKMYNGLYIQYYVLDAHTLNLSHYRMFQALICDDADEVRPVMVGDLLPSSKSNIYMTQNFVHDFNPKTYELTCNYRTSKRIVEFVNHLTNLQISPPCHNEGELKIDYLKNESEEAKFVCLRIYELTHNEQHSIAYDEIAIIARNKYSFSNVLTELSSYNIPFSFLSSTYNISFETDIFNVLFLVMKIINNPKEIYHNLLLCKLIERNELTINSDKGNIVEQILKGTKYDWMINIIGNLSQENELDFGDILNDINNNFTRQSSDYYNYLFENDLREWTEQWKRFRRRHSKKNWRMYAFFYALYFGEDLDLNLPSSIKLLTPDMFGNFKFDAVFVIDLAEGIFPDYRAISSGETAISQERDLLQSAVNFSKRLCYLSCAKSKEMSRGEIKFQEPSRFIADYNAADKSPSVSEESYKFAKESRSSQLFKRL